MGVISNGLESTDFTDKTLTQQLANSKTTTRIQFLFSPPPPFLFFLSLELKFVICKKLWIIFKEIGLKKKKNEWCYINIQVLNSK